MNVRDIVRIYLLKHRYEGLYTSGGCACRLCNLMPCDELHGDCGDCEPGYLQPLGDDEDDWKIGEKPDAKMDA
jgi:hypothetical protein